MDHDQLEFDLNRSPALRLIRSEHAPLVLGFLHLQFKQTQRMAIPYAELVERLETNLEILNERQPGRYPRLAKEYLKQWSDENHRFLRIYTRGANDEPLVELTADTEQAISWMEELNQRSFIGTESRFLHIFTLLEDVVARSTEDIETRLAQLEKQRDTIQREIDAIRTTGEVARYTTTQLKERFLQASEVARQLLRDFAAVERNFRTIARTVQEAQLQPDARKGAVVGSVLDADMQLKESDEGRSFYAFWEFLMSPSKQDELRALLDAIYRIPELQEVSHDNRLLRQLTRRLLDAGEKIVQSNHRLAEQLRRMLDERNIAERRRVRELIAEIKQAAFRLANDPPEDVAFFELEGLPDVQLVMEKGLWEPSEPVAFSAQPVSIGQADARDIDLARLYSQFVVDETRLRRRIDTLLEERPQLTLAEVVAAHPVEQGLSEIIAYLSVANRDPRHAIDEAQSERIVLGSPNDGIEPTVLTLPLVLFRRNHAR